MVDDFDYAKLLEEMEAMAGYLKQLSEEIIKMKGNFKNFYLVLTQIRKNIYTSIAL